MCIHSNVQLFEIPWTIVHHQAPLPMELSRQEYWNGLPFPPLEDLPNRGMIEPASPALAGGFFTTPISIKCFKTAFFF